MSDTPIYDGLEGGSHDRATEPHPVGWFTETRRRWLYGIAAAALPIIGGLVGWSAVEAGNVLNLIGAFLIVGGGPVAELARRNVR